MVPQKHERHNIDGKNPTSGFAICNFIVRSLKSYFTGLVIWYLPWYAHSNFPQCILKHCVCATQSHNKSCNTYIGPRGKTWYIHNKSSKIVIYLRLIWPIHLHWPTHRSRDGQVSPCENKKNGGHSLHFPWKMQYSKLLSTFTCI